MKDYNLTEEQFDTLLRLAFISGEVFATKSNVLGKKWELDSEYEIEKFILNCKKALSK